MPVQAVVYKKSYAFSSWKIVVPILAVVVLFVGGTFCLTFSLIGHSEVVTLAMQEAQKNPALVEKLGHPIERGFLIFGRMNTDSDDGYARVSIPISGPKGSGKLYLHARKRAGEWTFRTLTAHVNGEEINLLVKKNTSGNF